MRLETRHLIRYKPTFGFFNQFLSELIVGKILMPKQLGCQAVVHSLAVPSRYACPGLDMQFFQSFADASLCQFVGSDLRHPARDPDYSAALVAEYELAGP